MTRPAELLAHEYDGVYDPAHLVSRATSTLVETVEALRARFDRLAQADAEARVVAEAQWAAARAASIARETRPSEVDRPASYSAPLAKQPDYVRALAEMRKVEAAERTLAGQMLLALVAALDTFEGELMRSAFKIRPELLKTSHREIVWSDVAHLDDIDAVRGLVVEREIDFLLRQGREEQLRTLATRFSLGELRLPELPALTELCDRRNLFAHRGGRVSAHYLRAHGRTLPEPPVVGCVLTTDGAYFDRACDDVIMVAVQLAQAVWRQVGGRAEVPAADRDLGHLGYVLLVQERWALARRVHAFATELRVHSSEQQRLVFLVNLAQSHKWAGDDTGCRAVLEREDWSARDHGLQLSAAVLRDDVARAAALMLDAGSVQHVSRSAFDFWPVYREFRRTPEFRRTYRHLYGEDPPVMSA